MFDNRLDFELNFIYDKLKDVEKDYESNKGSHQEHIHDIIFDKNNKMVRVLFKTYAFIVLTVEDEYRICWFHKDDERYVHDGTEKFSDIDETFKRLKEFIYGGFCPVRTSWWQNKPRPDKDRYRKKGTWA